MIDTVNIVQPPAWYDDAACLEVDAELFFPAKNESTRPAQRVCAGCGVREQCLAYSPEHGFSDGVWGGLGPAGRRRMLTVAQRGAQQRRVDKDDAGRELAEDSRWPPAVVDTLRDLQGGAQP